MDCPLTKIPTNENLPKGSRNKPKTSSAAAARELEEAKKYLQKPIRGPGRFLPIAMVATGLGAGWYHLKKQQNSSVVVNGNHSDPVVVPMDSKKNDAKDVNNTIKKPIDHTFEYYILLLSIDRPF